MTLKYGDMTTNYYYIWIRDVINLICFVYFGIFVQSTAYGVGNFLMYVMQYISKYWKCKYKLLKLTILVPWKQILNNELIAVSQNIQDIVV